MDELSQLEESRDIPVVLVTADIHIEKKITTAPYRGGLKKPVDLDALLALVAKFVARRQ